MSIASVRRLLNLDRAMVHTKYFGVIQLLIIERNYLTQLINKLEMKNFKRILIIAFIGSGSLAMVGCGGATSGNTEAKEVAVESHGEGTAYTSAYVCPMHCKDSGSDQAGNCPACGMDYVSQADHANDGHAH